MTKTARLRVEIWLWIIGYVLVTMLFYQVGAAAQPAAPPEVRGTWMTTTANDAIATPDKTAESMKQLRDIGLNTVYVETWKNGYTQYPSQTLERTIGLDRRPNLMPDQTGMSQPRDLLEETLIQAHRNGLIYIAWFEYGFMAAFKDTHNHLRQQYPQWMTTTIDGELVSGQNPFVWMNPLRPETRAFLLDLVLEAVDNYDLDGVQLDDRIAWPVTMGYDPYTVEAYKAEHNGQAPPKDPRDPAWVRWRADKVTEFAHTFYTELKKRRPNLIVSISPAVYPWSLEHYACDWPAWNRKGWMDEFVPQVYRSDFKAFKPTWEQQVQAIGSDREKLLAGIRIVGTGPDTTWEDMVEKMDLVRQSRVGGHVHWFSRGVLEVYPQQLTAYYDVARNGAAPHPHLPRGWRPSPIVADRESGDVWRARVTQPGQYRVIAKRNGVWTVEELIAAEAGDITVKASDADAVELLVDRRDAAPIK